MGGSGIIPVVISIVVFVAILLVLKFVKNLDDMVSPIYDFLEDLL